MDSRSASCGHCLRTKPAPPLPAPAAVKADRERAGSSAKLSQLQQKYNEALSTLDRYEQMLELNAALQVGCDSHTIEPTVPSGTSEATVVAVASDWHIEENVGAEVGGLNEYNMEIAQERADRFFRKTLRLTELLQKDIHIDTMVLALLGDFISNDIHDELVDQNQLQPIHAILKAGDFLTSGIDYLLEHSDLRIVLPCHSGNHARTTKKTRFSSENGHSLEYLLYHYLAAHYRKEDRLKFIIPPGPHSYVKVQNLWVRFQHGHMVKYGGGVGGITIPLNKAIAQWNKARQADLDILGHFHQLVDGGNFIVNGSLIGYNAFALSIKASYEPPKQALQLVDNKRGRTAMWPIYVSGSEIKNGK